MWLLLIIPPFTDITNSSDIIKHFSYKLSQISQIYFFRLVNVQGLYQNVGCNIALLEYRGYGRSDGTPSEEGMYMDAQVYYSIYGQMEPLVRRGCIWMHTGIPNSDFNYNDNWISF